MDDHVARLDEGEEQGRDGRHAAREGQRLLRILPDAQAILEYLLVRPVAARIDKALGTAWALAGTAFEMALARRRGLEDEGGGAKVRWLQRAFRQRRVEAMAHHQLRGLALPPPTFQHTPLG